MARVLLVSTALLVLLLPAAPQDRAIFRSSVQTVVLHATVRNDAGRLVPDLTAADFEVRDEGQLVQISVFSNDPQPITVALLLDMSGSMVSQFRRVRDATKYFVEAIQPGDRVRIGTFGDEVALSPLLTGDKSVLRQIVAHELWPGGGTPLWNAVNAGMQSLAKEPGRRVVLVLTDGIEPPRAILLLTDGRSTGNARSLDMVAEHAALHGVALHSIVRYVEVQIPHGDQVLVIVRPWVAFERLAFYTGGTAVAYAMPQHLEGLDRAGKLGGAIRDTYAIAISPGDHDQPRRLSIRAKRSGLNVLAPRVLFPANTR